MTVVSLAVESCASDMSLSVAWVKAAAVPVG